MSFQNKIQEVQRSLKEQDLAGWLIYDFRGCNSLAYIFLDIPADHMMTRRFFYWIPQQGDPIKIVSQIEPYNLDHLPGNKWIYRGWQELEQLLSSLIPSDRSIAMEYSPDNALPVVSKVDAGTIEFIRKKGAQVVSSANLLQRYTSVWTPSQLKTHLFAADLLGEIVEKTWKFIKQALDSRRLITEYQVQQFMLEEMHKQKCVTNHPPICAVNAHSADPHYAPQKEGSATIQPGDFILLDLWCKLNESQAVYADITRVGVAGPSPTVLQQEIFQIVKQARDTATKFVETHYTKNQTIQGWQVDQVCRDVIHHAGYGDYFIHRTGHNIGIEVHGPGANLDNLETHDFRNLMSGTCFSVEPGIYLPGQFGIRMEYDVYLDLEGKVLVTGGIQQEIICLNIP